VRFRGARAGECAASEGALLCDDLHRLHYDHAVVDPSVQVAYRLEAARALQARQQGEKERVARERGEGEVAERALVAAGVVQGKKLHAQQQQQQQQQQQHEDKKSNVPTKPQQQQQGQQEEATRPPIAPAKAPTHSGRSLSTTARRRAAFAPWRAVEEAYERYWLLDHIDYKRIECCDVETPVGALLVRESGSGSGSEVVGATSPAAALRLPSKRQEEEEEEAGADASAEAAQDLQREAEGRQRVGAEQAGNGSDGAEQQEEMAAPALCGLRDMAALRLPELAEPVEPLNEASAAALEAAQRVRRLQATAVAAGIGS